MAIENATPTSVSEAAAGHEPLSEILWGDLQLVAPEVMAIVDDTCLRFEGSNPDALYDDAAAWQSRANAIIESVVDKLENGRSELSLAELARLVGCLTGALTLLSMSQQLHETAHHMLMEAVRPQVGGVSPASAE